MIICMKALGEIPELYCCDAIKKTSHTEKRLNKKDDGISNRFDSLQNKKADDGISNRFDSLQNKKADDGNRTRIFSLGS